MEEFQTEHKMKTQHCAKEGKKKKKKRDAVCDLTCKKTVFLLSTMVTTQTLST